MVRGEGPRDHFERHFPSKINEHIDAEKVMTFMNNLCENGIGTYWKYIDFRKIVSRKNELSEKGIPTEASILLQ